MANTKPERKTILYIATSLDGYIAGPGDNLDFLSLGSLEGEDYGYKAFEETVDTMIMGRRTYEWVMRQLEKYPFSHLETYVLTSEHIPNSQHPIYYNGEISSLVANLKSKPGKHIFVNGGAKLITAMMHQNLIDEYIIFIFPILLGDGTRLFRSGRPEEHLKLVDTHAYQKGIVKVHYVKEQ